jgi:hypothetical protein
MLISSTLSRGPERMYRSSDRRKSSVNTPTKPVNSSQRKMQRMVEYCAHSDAIFWYHGRVDLYLDEADFLSLATRATGTRSRAFNCRAPIPSRDCGNAPGVSSHLYLTMSSSSLAFKFNSPVNTPHLCFSPLTQCTTSPNLALAAALNNHSQCSDQVTTIRHSLLPTS